MAHQPVIRLNDTSSHGGHMIQAQSVGLKANGIAVCVDQDNHTCPIPGHGITHVTSGINTKSGGKSVIVVGCTAACGAILNSGSPSVNAA